MVETTCQCESAEEVRQCCRCNCWRPITDYRMRNAAKGLRHTDCKACHSAELVDLRARRRARVLNEFAREVHRLRHCSADRLAMLVERMVCKFGGMDGFSTTWKGYIDLAGEQGRAHIALRHMFCIIELSAAYSSPQRPNELSRMTEDELQQDLQRNLLALMVRYGEQHDDARRMAERVIAAMGDNGF